MSEDGRKSDLPKAIVGGVVAAVVLVQIWWPFLGQDHRPIYWAGLACAIGVVAITAAIDARFIYVSMIAAVIFGAASALVGG